MKSVSGDLICLANEGYFNVIIHGCNCFNEMGKGIACQIKDNYPEAYEADCKTICGDKNKLGTYSVATTPGCLTNPATTPGCLTNPATTPGCLTIINAYTQYKYKGRNNIDYDAVRTVFRKIAEDFPDSRIGIPKIGAGMAGGKWSLLQDIIMKETDHLDITLVKFKKPRQPCKK